ncbi:MAG: sulfite exporter TauE/SafE family protein [Pseudolabrys sp.]
MTLLTNPLFLAAAIAAVTFLGISKGGFIGLGVTAVPLLSLIVPPPQAAAILLPILLVQDAVSVFVYHRDYSLWNLQVLIPGAAAGAVLATLVAASVSADAVKLAVGLIAVLFVASRIAAPWLERHLPKPAIASGLFWGTVAGFTSTLANAGSPPYQIHMLPQRLPKLTLVGTTSLYFAATNVLKIPSYFALGQLTWSNLSVGLALVPLAVATNFLGVWLVRRVSIEAFYAIAYGLIFLIGLVLVRSAALALLA